MNNLSQLSSVIVTKKGKEMLLNTMLKNSIKFTKVVMSEEEYQIGDLEELERIIENQSVDITNVEMYRENQVKIDIRISNENLTDAYYLKTIGIFAKDNNTEILFAACIEQSGNCYMESLDKGISGAFIEFYVTVSNADKISLEVNPAGVATLQDINRLQIHMTEHIDNKSNPHGTTKEQLGLSEVNNTADINKPTSDPQKKYIEDNYLSLKGGTVAGNIKLKPFSRINNPLDIREGNIDGDGLLVTAGGTTIIGGGEFPQNMFETGSDEVLPAKENLIVGADQNTYILSAGQNISGRTGVVLDTGGNLKPVTVDGTIKSVNLGTSTAKYKNVYADNINGNVSAANVVQDDNNRFVSATEKAKINSLNTDFTGHTANMSNPHGVTKAQVGLGNVDNTADSAKSVNYATSAGTVPWNGVSGKPSTFTPTAHIHDDRYYTETEMNTKFSDMVTNLRLDGKSFNLTGNGAVVVDVPYTVPSNYYISGVLAVRSDNSAAVLYGYNISNLGGKGTITVSLANRSVNAQTGTVHVNLALTKILF